MRTVALERLIVLEDPSLVNQTLLFGGDVAVASDDLLEGSDGGIEANLNGKLRTIGASNVDVDSSSIGGVGFRRRTTLNGTVTSHGVASLRQKHGRRIRSQTPQREKGDRNPNPRTIEGSEIGNWGRKWELGI